MPWLPLGCPCFDSTIVTFLTRVNTCPVSKQWIGQSWCFSLFSMKQLFYISHENVNPFIGICTEAPTVSVLMLYADRGSLQDVLTETKYDINWEFRICLATDIAKVVCPHVNPSQISSSFENDLSVSDDHRRHTQSLYRPTEVFSLLMSHWRYHRSNQPAFITAL